MKLDKLINLYSSEESCLNFIRKKQWPKDAFCPKCKKRNLSTYKGKTLIKKYRCNCCGNIFSDISNTPLKRCRIKLNLLVQVTLCLKSGFSIRKTANSTGINPKTVIKIKKKKNDIAAFFKI